MCLFGFFFLFLSPFMAPLIILIWLILLIRFGYFPLLLEHSRITADEKMHLAKNITQVMLGIGIVGILVTPFLVWNIPLLPYLDDLDLATIERNFHIVRAFLYSPLLTILIVEGWLVLTCYFGLSYVLSHLGLPINQQHLIRTYTTIGILVIGILTVLIGFVWWKYLVTTDWKIIKEVYDFGSMELSSTTSLLTIGMLVMLYISLNKSLEMEQNIERYEHIAKNMGLALVLTLTMLGVVGGAISIGIHYERIYFLVNLR